MSERVSFERAEEVGKSCGYSVRFESVLPRPHASILFCTVGKYHFLISDCGTLRRAGWYIAKHVLFTGVLLRKLESGIRGISHVIVDEIHERDLNVSPSLPYHISLLYHIRQRYPVSLYSQVCFSVQTDFLLVVLRDVVQAYPDVRVILMSATIDTTMFKEYFFNCPVIEVHGRAHPVQGQKQVFSMHCIIMYF